MTVKGSSFKNNTATDGGAIYNTDDTLDVTGSTFTDNTATGSYVDGDGGGAIFNGSTLSVNGSTLTGNHAMGGGAILNTDDGTAVLHFNQIVGNTANTGNAIYNSYGEVNATLNWWGYNLGVNIAKQIYSLNVAGTVTYNPWIILTITANPVNVTVGGNSTITAELLYSFNGSKVVYNNPAKGVVPYTGYANFSTTNGTIKNVKFVNGKAISTLTNLSIAGVDTVYVKVDCLILAKKVTVQP